MHHLHISTGACPSFLPWHPSSTRHCCLHLPSLSRLSKSYILVNMFKDLIASALLLATCTSATATSHLVSKRSSVDTFVANERAKAVKGVLANIGPDGALATNASRGIVIGG